MSDLPFHRIPRLMLVHGLTEAQARVLAAVIWEGSE